MTLLFITTAKTKEITNNTNNDSPQQVFMQYLENKKENLPAKEKEEISFLSEMEPSERMSYIIKKLQSEE